MYIETVKQLGKEDKKTVWPQRVGISAMASVALTFGFLMVPKQLSPKFPSALQLGQDRSPCEPRATYPRSRERKRDGPWPRTWAEKVEEYIALSRNELIYASL
ncbi:Protein of unknown function [Gryllus bimaculatus]|nr:Protein of unknown function [Gryllus bimaculatus]